MRFALLGCLAVGVGAAAAAREPTITLIGRFPSGGAELKRAFDPTTDQMKHEFFSRLPEAQTFDELGFRVYSCAQRNLSLEECMKEEPPDPPKTWGIGGNYELRSVAKNHVSAQDELAWAFRAVDAARDEPNEIRRQRLVEDATGQLAVKWDARLREVRKAGRLYAHVAEIKLGPYDAEHQRFPLSLPIVAFPPQNESLERSVRLVIDNDPDGKTGALLPWIALAQDEAEALARQLPDRILTVIVLYSLKEAVTDQEQCCPGCNPGGCRSIKAKAEFAAYVDGRHDRIEPGDKKLKIRWLRSAMDPIPVAPASALQPPVTQETPAAESQSSCEKQMEHWATQHLWGSFRKSSARAYSDAAHAWLDNFCMTLLASGYAEPIDGNSYVFSQYRCGWSAPDAPCYKTNNEFETQRSVAEATKLFTRLVGVPVWATRITAHLGDYSAERRAFTGVRWPQGPWAQLGPHVGVWGFYIGNRDDKKLFVDEIPADPAVAEAIIDAWPDRKVPVYAIFSLPPSDQHTKSPRANVGALIFTMPTGQVVWAETTAAVADRFNVAMSADQEAAEAQHEASILALRTKQRTAALAKGRMEFERARRTQHDRLGDAYQVGLTCRGQELASVYGRAKKLGDAVKRLCGDLCGNGSAPGGDVMSAFQCQSTCRAMGRTPSGCSYFVNHIPEEKVDWLVK